MKCKIEECKSIKIRARGLCAIHWNLEQYGECSNGCRQPASSKTGLCPNCKKRGNAPPANRSLGWEINDDKRRLCSRCKKIFPIEEFDKSHHMNRCIECQTLMKRHSHLRDRYRISLEEFEVLLKKQNGCCKICGDAEAKMVVDHDHSCCSGYSTCGKCIRGLLCSSCNTAIGHIKDSSDTAYAMFLYLKNVEYLEFKTYN